MNPEDTTTGAKDAKAAHASTNSFADTSTRFSSSASQHISSSLVSGDGRTLIRNSVKAYVIPVWSRGHRSIEQRNPPQTRTGSDRLLADREEGLEVRWLGFAVDGEDLDVAEAGLA